MVVKTIKLTSLFVNTENYRFEPLSSQKEAIDKMVEDQGDKLYSLVDDIVTNGLSPVDLIIVTPNEDNNKYIVLEGNVILSADLAVIFFKYQTSSSSINRSSNGLLILLLKVSAMWTYLSVVLILLCPISSFTILMSVPCSSR